MNKCWLLLCVFAFPASAAEQFKDEQSAQQHCPTDSVVWLNPKSGNVHSKGMKWYGRTQIGAYVCQQELTSLKVKPELKAQSTEPWHKVLEDNHRTVYASSAAMEKKGNRVTILSMVDLKEAAALSDGKPFLSWETQYEFDCKKMLSRVIAASMYSANMGEGDVTSSVIYDTPAFQLIQPESNGELLWKLACGKK